MSSGLDIKLYKVDKVYRPGELIRGEIIVGAAKQLSHNGVTLNVEGTVTQQYNNSKSFSGFESELSQLKPIRLIEISTPLVNKGKFSAGTTKVPFSFPLKPTGNHPLYETYHGVYLAIRYRLHVDLARGLLSKPLKRTLEFIVQVPNQGWNVQNDKKEIPFTMTPKLLENVKRKMIEHVPDFEIVGKVDCPYTDITKPFTGSLVVKRSENKIKSIDLQLVRVESVQLIDKPDVIKEATEIQNLQIADGNVCRGMSIPIYMTPPRLFSCPTVITQNFRIQFEINLIILFRNGQQVTENFRNVAFYRKGNKTIEEPKEIEKEQIKIQPAPEPEPTSSTTTIEIVEDNPLA
mmetsp:Transcript_6933/g.10143  ORF Transcript_6933/g.10143 Transcript_6933/m.10143 type:complete len:348 (+) Transcript_6933:21-1064(+)